MNASYCPKCSHCQLKKELREQLENARLDREEREAAERLAEERRQKRKAARKLVEQGVIYGNNFDAYTAEDIRNITNYDFLEKLSFNICPSAQPPNDFEQEYLNERVKAVHEQLNEVLINELE